MKRSICILLSVATALLCSACAGRSGSSDEANEQLTYYYTEEYKDDMVEKIERYNRWCINHSTEDMKIKLIAFDNFETMSRRLNIEVMAGGGPDLYSNYMDLPFEQLMKNDAFCDINDLIQNDTSNDKLDLSKYNQTVMDAGLYNGKRCFVPVFYRVHTLVGEKKLLEKYHLPTEQGFHLTFDNMDEVFADYLQDPGSVRFLSSDERSGALNADTVMLRLVNSGVDLEHQTVRFDEDFQQKLELTAQLRRRSDVSRTEPEKVTEAGSKYLFHPQHSYSNPIYMEWMMRFSGEIDNQDKVSDPVLYTCFEKDQDTYSAGIVDAVFVKANTKKGDKALAFIKYLLSSRVQNLYTGTSEENATRSDIDYLPVLNKAFENCVADAQNAAREISKLFGIESADNGLSPVTDALVEHIKKINSVELYFDLYASGYDRNVAVPILTDYWNGIINAKKCTERLSSATKIFMGE